jgi:cell division protein FtsI/penicillin-binding protein 2
MPGRTDSRRRLLFVLGVVVLVAGAAVVRTAQWQVLEREHLVALARAQTTVRVEERMQRGTIYDRTGTVVLATTVDRDRLVGSPAQLRPAERVAVADQLVTLLGLTGAEALSLRDRFTTDDDYVILRGRSPTGSATRSRSAASPASPSSPSPCGSIPRSAEGRARRSPPTSSAS